MQTPPIPDTLSFADLEIEATRNWKQAVAIVNEVSSKSLNRVDANTAAMMVSLISAATQALALVKIGRVLDEDASSLLR